GRLHDDSRRLPPFGGTSFGRVAVEPSWHAAGARPSKPRSRWISSMCRRFRNGGWLDNEGTERSPRCPQNASEDLCNWHSVVHDPCSRGWRRCPSRQAHHTDRSERALPRRSIGRTSPNRDEALHWKKSKLHNGTLRRIPKLWPYQRHVLISAG